MAYTIGLTGVYTDTSGIAAVSTSAISTGAQFPDIVFSGNQGGGKIAYKVELFDKDGTSVYTARTSGACGIRLDGGATSTLVGTGRYICGLAEFSTGKLVVTCHGKMGGSLTVTGSGAGGNNESYQATLSGSGVVEATFDIAVTEVA